MCNVTFPHKYLFIPVSEEVVLRKKAAKVCISYRCRRRAADGFKCHTCRARLKRINNPLYYAYENLRSSARKRGIQFLLTRPEFEEFCKEHGYLEKRGKLPDSMSIDRKDTNGPYSKDNIRPLGYLDNCSHKFETPLGTEVDQDAPFG